MKRARNPETGDITQVPDKEFDAYKKLGWEDADAAPEPARAKPGPKPKEKPEEE